MNKSQPDFEIKCYLKGYRDGFDAALKIAWAHAEELLTSVDNTDKGRVQEYINKLKQ